MDSSAFREVEEVLDRHARRVAGELGKLLIGVGEALRDEAAKSASANPKAGRAPTEPTRDDLYREAARLGINGRSRMTKKQLRDAVAEARRRR